MTELQPTTPTSGVQRVVAALTAARSWAARPQLRPWLIGVSLVVFLAVTAWSVVNLPDLGDRVRPGLLLVLVVAGAPLALLASTLELQAIARVAGVRLATGPAATATVAASVANLLPLPGSVVVRAGVLAREGAGLGAIARATAAGGLLQLTVALGFLGAVAGRLDVAGVCAAAATVGLVVAAGLMGRDRVLLGRLAVAEVILVGVAAARLAIALAGLGYPAGVRGTAGLTAASVLATAAAVAPGGLGLRELLSGAVAPLVAVPAAVGALSGAVDRVAFLVGVVVTVGPVWLARRVRRAGPVRGA